MGMLYFVVVLALIGCAAVFGLRKHNNRQRHRAQMREQSIDQGNPFI